MTDTDLLLIDDKKGIELINKLNPSIVASFDESICNKIRNQGIEPKNLENFLSNKQSRIKNDEFDIMRKWLRNLSVYKEINLGLLLQDTFINFYARQLIRQYKIIHSLINSIDPTRIDIYSSRKPVYKWFKVGDKVLHVPLIKSICSSQEINCYIHPKYPINILKDSIFKYTGPFVLSKVDHITESLSRLHKRKNKINSSNKSFLIYLSNTNNLDVLKPVIYELNKRNYNPLIIFHSHGFYNYRISNFKEIDKINNRVKKFESYQDKHIYKIESQNKKNLTKKWENIKNNQEKHKEFNIDDDIVWNALKDRFWLYYKVQFPRMIRYIETAKNIIKSESPKGIIVKADGPTPNRTFIRVANNQGIPTFLIQHGMLFPWKNYIPISKYMTVWGDKWKQIVKKKGNKKTNIKVTGGPHFDKLSKRKFNKVKLRNKVGIQSKNRIITLATQPFDDEVRKKLIKTTLEYIKPINKITFLLRPHPRENPSIYKEFIDKNEIDIHIVENQNIFEIIAISDILLSISSTVIFEASLLKTPCLILSYTSERNNEFFSSDNGFMEIHQPKELTNKIKNILDSDRFRSKIIEKQPKFGKKYAYNQDSNATKRVVDLLEEKTK